MFQVQGHLYQVQLQHRHTDGSWGDMEAMPDDPANHDPERGWEEGQLFLCKACGDQVRVSHAGDEPFTEATA
jgi:hypothetical protein